MNKQATLQSVFGYDTFREGQEEIIDALLAGQDVLGIMPTGAGKSICYQLPALLLPGLTLVVSPLISLMQDQVGALIQAGVPAAYLNSSLSANQFALALQRAAEGRYKIIYVAPERLETTGFISFAQSADISLVCVDEAHCVSQWGQDFRPSYLAIPAFVERLPRRPVVAAFTATATAEVKADITALLRLENPHQLTTGFDRKNLTLEVRRPANKLAELYNILHTRQDKSGIIYCATRKAVEEVCEALCARGYAATRYHAGLRDTERAANQTAFLHDDKTVMVATNAFGMGIDKSNVSYVVHYNMPKNLESYYQEAGRAGRDGEKADCILLYSPGDVRTARFLIENSREADESLPAAQRDLILQNELELLKKMTFYATTTDCLRGYILRYFGEKAEVYCGNCSNCNTTFEEVDIAPAATQIFACLAELSARRRSFGKAMLANILRGSRVERVLSMGLDSLPSYGSLKEMDSWRLGAILDHLLACGALAVTEGEYPVLTLTGLSDSFVASGNTVLKLPQQARPKQDKLAAAHPDLDTALFSRLRQTRAALAKQAGVPAYVVFTDATLRDMCAKKPTDQDAFLQVSGVGTSKLERYGDAFIAEILDYVLTQEQAGQAGQPG